MPMRRVLRVGAAALALGGLLAAVGAVVAQADHLRRVAEQALHRARDAARAAPEAAPLEPDTMRAAIDLGRYFTDHARAAYDAMGQDPAADDAQHLVNWLRDTGTAAFSQRDLYMATRARFPRVEALLPALRALERHGYVRRRPAPRRASAGRPASPVYDVNPLVGAESPDSPNSAHCAHSARGGVNARGPAHCGRHRVTSSTGSSARPARMLPS